MNDEGIHRDLVSARRDYAARIGQNDAVAGLADRITSVQREISAAAESVGRDPRSVTLVAVSKTVPISEIQAAYDLGLRHFGESRLQEAEPKMAALPGDIIWHFIGRLQTNKAKRIAQRFAVIHGLDDPRQLTEIEKAGRAIDGLVAVNIGEEAQKSGVFAKNLDEMVASVIQCKLVRFRGLMTIGPQVSNPEESRAKFRRLAELGSSVHSEWLSMGMTADFAVAIQEGSTHVRIGSAIFGSRA